MSQTLRKALTLATCAALAALAAGGAAAEDAAARAARALLAEHCIDCHSGDAPKAGLDIERLLAGDALSQRHRVWLHLAGTVAAREMPPKGKAQPSDAQRAQLVGWIRSSVQAAAAARAGDPGDVPPRRLTHGDYDRTVRDLTGLDLRLSRDFPGETAGGEGFTNVGAVQPMTEQMWRKYLDAAKQVAGRAVFQLDGAIHFASDGLVSQPPIRARYFSLEIERTYQRIAGDLRPYLALAWWRRHGAPPDEIAAFARAQGLSPKFLATVGALVREAPPTPILRSVHAELAALPAPSAAQRAAIEASLPAFAPLLAPKTGTVERWRDLLCDEHGMPNAPEVREVADIPIGIPRQQKPTDLLLTIVATDAGLGRTATLLVEDPTVPAPRPDKKRKEPPPGAGPSLRGLLERHAPQALARLPWKQADGVWVLELRAPAVLEIALPAAAAQEIAGRHLVARARLAEDGLAQVAVVVGKPAASAGLLPAVPFIARGAAAVELAQRSYADFLAVFARRFMSPLEFIAEGKHWTPSARRWYDQRLLPYARGAQLRMRADGSGPEWGTLRDIVVHRVDDRPFRASFLDESMAAAWDRRIEVAWHADRIAQANLSSWVCDYSPKISNGLGSDSPTTAMQYFERGDLAAIADGLVKGFPFVNFGHPHYLAPTLENAQASFRYLLEDYERWRATPEPLDQHLAAVAGFAERAWRRPLRDAERASMRGLVEQARGQGLDHEQAMRLLLVRVLTAPDFLYRIEAPAAASATPGGSAPVSPRELAVRLSYFLWGSLPDAALLAAAADGSLLHEAVLERQARRLLADERSAGLAEQFFGQWLKFSDMAGVLRPDPERFPQVTETLKQAMADEPRRFCADLVRCDRPVTDLLFADHAFVNGELARHYGLRGVAGAQWQRVDNVAAAGRGGVIAMAGFLARFSSPLRTSPVRRGDWIHEVLLGVPVPPPPMDVPALPEDERQAGAASMREHLARHRAQPSCAACHARFDGLGLALEGFGPAGEARNADGAGRAIDVRADMPGGAGFTGYAGLREYLRGRQDEFLRAFAEKLTGYALGRGLLASDQPLVDAILARLAARERRFAEAAVEIVLSRQFRQRRVVR